MTSEGVNVFYGTLEEIQRGEQNNMKRKWL
jgi:hypothetical protein